MVQTLSERVVLSKSYFTVPHWPAGCIGAFGLVSNTGYLQFCIYIHTRALVTADLISSAKMRLTHANFQ